MLISNRFTNTLTKSTKKRFVLVLNNRRPLTRREKNRGAVVAIQTALSDLNKGYLIPAQVDGFYGNATASAVEMFQRDYGLFADGVFGRQTLLELDQLFSSEIFRPINGMSIHVGVNHVDSKHYGSDFPLEACVNDARAFRDISISLGYDDILLVNEDATTVNFTSAMRQAVNNLFSGDYLFITFSGHGSQVTNNVTDEEADLLDETLCFYDRMLLDDEIYALLSELKVGVQVIALYDSCHSGTVTKKISLDIEDNNSIKTHMLRVLEPINPDIELGDDTNIDNNLFMPFESKSLEAALDGDNAPVVEKTVNIKSENVTEILSLVIDTIKDIEKGTQKVIRPFQSNEVYNRNIDLYTSIKSIVGSREQEKLDCNVVALSACQDNQTTLDGTINGLFTGNILRTWDDGGFKGSYKQMHSRLVRQSDSTITPTLNTYGGSRAEARLHERPFMF